MAKQTESWYNWWLMSVKTVLDGAAITTAIATVVQWAPPVAALFSIFWLCMQIIINWDKFVLELKRMFTRK